MTPHRSLSDDDLARFFREAIEDLPEQHREAAREWLSRRAAAWVLVDEWDSRARASRQMARHELTDSKVRALTKPGIFSDGDGLYVRVPPTGSKSGSSSGRTSVRAARSASDRIAPDVPIMSPLLPPVPKLKWPA